MWFERSLFLKKKNQGSLFFRGLLKCHSKVTIFAWEKSWKIAISVPQILKELGSPTGTGTGTTMAWRTVSEFRVPSLWSWRCWVFFVSKKQVSSVTLMVLGIGPCEKNSAKIIKIHGSSLKIKMIFDCLPTLKTWFWQPPTYVDIYIYIHIDTCVHIYIHIHIFFQSTRLPCVFQTSKLIIFWEFIGFSYPQNSNHRGPPTMAGTLATLATLYPPIICICWFGTPGVFPRFFSKFGAILLWDKKRELRIPWISVWSFFTWKHRSDAPKLPRSCWKRNKKKTNFHMFTTRELNWQNQGIPSRIPLLERSSAVQPYLSVRPVCKKHQPFPNGKL